MTEREKIAGLIRALRAKTVENGCTEGEALAAAEKIAELLARYNMTLDEADLRASPFERHTETHTDWAGERLWKIAAAVSKLTGVRYWQSRPGVYPIEINVFGFRHEVDVARYLIEICARAMRSEQARILCSDRRLITLARQRRAVTPFLDGMADRLHRRILDMIPERLPGTGLIVLRHELILAAMRDSGIKTESHSARSSRDFEASYLDGKHAANRVALNRALEAARDPTTGLLR